MMMTMTLEKTLRMNQLIAFYGRLVTEKQYNMLRLYYEEDYSLGEIATHYNISRQAVYDNLKRAEQQLESYEATLQLIAKMMKRQFILTQLQEAVVTSEDRQVVLEYINQLSKLEE